MSTEKLKVKEEESLASLLPDLAKIKQWQKDINAVKGDKIKTAELRRKFKNIFGVPFGQKLVADLIRLEKGEGKEKEKEENKEKPVQPLVAVVEGAKTLQADVHEQQSLEVAMAQTIINPELNKQTLYIDEKKKEVVANAIDGAEDVALKASKEAEEGETTVDNQTNGELKKEDEMDRVDEEALRQEILSTKEAVLAEINAGYQAERKAHNFELEEKIRQADSFDSLLNIIKESEGIQGSKEFFSPEMLFNVLTSIRSGEAPLSAATSGLGFRETVERLLSSEHKIMEAEVSKCNSLEDFISLLNKFPELAVLGGDIKNINEYISYFSREVEFTEQLYIADNFKNEEHLNNALNFATRRYGLRDKVTQYIIKKNGLHFKDDPAKKIREEVNDPVNSGLEHVDGPKENKSESQKREKQIAPEALDYFYDLGLNDKDLLSIPGLTELNSVSQLLIAKSLKNLALEKANRNVSKKQADASAVAKGFWGKLSTGISNAFKIGKQKKEAILEQAHGGLAEHKVELTRLVDWAQNLDLKEIETEEGRFMADFTGHFDLKNINEKQAAIVKEMNENANWLASCAKEYRLFTYTPEPKGSKTHQEYYQAKRAYDDSRKQMSALLSNDLNWSEASVLQAINKMDANVNMVQFMSANPDLEKDWQEMIKNKSVLAKAFAKDNWKFFASGYAGRMALGSVLGFVAIPAVAMAVGAWRGREKGRQALRNADKGLEKKDLPGDSPLLTERKMVLKAIQELVPTEYAFNREEWLAKVANPEQKSLYYDLRVKFNDLDARWRQEEEKKKGEHNKERNQEYTSGKNIERKVLRAETLMSKLQNLIDKAQQAEGEKRAQLLFQLSRRVNFSKDLVDKGLINFGSVEERSSRMLDFYQLLSQGQILQLDKDVQVALVAKGDYESVYEDVNIKELSKLNERAEDLLNSLEYFAEMQLDKNRRSFLKKKILQGAIVGGVFATSGALVRELSGSWLEDKAAAGFRFISENTKFGTAVSDTISDIKNYISPNLNSLAGSSAVETATWSDQISNEGLKAGQYDSVWLSTKNIFESHAAELGYQGDINDVAALRHWAEIQTNRTLADTGDITDKVFVGNKVTLEKNGDNFIVRVEAGSGAQPGYLSETSIDLPSGKDGLQETPPNPDGSQPIQTPDTFIDSKGVPNVGKVREIWADRAGARFGLSSEQVSYADENVIKAEIDGYDVFIDTQNNTFLFFDDNANEVSGLLVDDNGHLINNAEEFLRSKFFSEEASAVGALDYLSNDNVEQDASSSLPELEPSLPSSQTEAPQSLNQSDIPNQFDNIINNYVRETTGGSIKEALEIIAARTKTPADKVLLEYIEENHISPDASLSDLLSSDAGLLMSMNSPENSVLTELYDLRHASSSQAQAEMLYKYLHTALSEDLKDAGKLAHFNKLASLNAFRVGSSLDGKVDTLVMQVGDNVRKVDFSAKGISEVLKFVKQML